MTGEKTSKRRTLLQSLGSLGVASLAGCVSDSLLGNDENGDRGRRGATDGEVTPRPIPSGPADENVRLTAKQGAVQPGGDSGTETWLYDEKFPGPELRIPEGNVLQADVTNQLPEGTTVHWHGIPVPNPMDGVPDVTQDPISNDQTDTYKYRAEPAGTYFYHSHVGLQFDRALVGPLIIEEESPHVEYDREYTVFLDDYLDEAPRLPSSLPGGGPGGDGGGPGGGGGGPGDGGGPGGGGGGGGPGGMGGRDGRGGMGDHRPPYEGMLMNGQLPSDAPTFELTEGERVRFRFVNGSGATTFRVRLAGHRFSVTHADGRPVEPVAVDAFDLGTGERYDAVVEADSPGSWELRADPVDGDETSALGVVQYGESQSGSPRSPSADSRRLQYGDLRALNPIQGISGRPDRSFDLTLSGNMGGSYEWYIDGQAYPDADPLRVSTGDHVRIRMVNRSPVVHPMHLHGHFFQVGDAVKDTVRVPPRMGEVVLDFVADNPGDWLFHCHNIYHLEAGMARVLTYES
ncbi:multicopper oxidase family protein [Halostella sp. JP-L12]|uniref:multicopper oxidase family protein n=1 Tax=Halostella TaxID=1843185 RepID=UPI000EF767DA|nr:MULTISPECIES: multicopper oxidase family protein [Halostella]NHN47976.1 multicopper oxidase family protein [Halostella sp. JP-L12]